MLAGFRVYKSFILSIGKVEFEVLRSHWAASEPISYRHRYSIGAMDFSMKSRSKCAGCGQRFTKEGYLIRHENQCKKRKEKSLQAWNAAAELKRSRSAASEAGTCQPPSAPSAKRQEIQNKLTSLLGLVQPKRKRARKDAVDNVNTGLSSDLPLSPAPAEEMCSSNWGSPSTLACEDVEVLTTMDSADNLTPMLDVEPPSLGKRIRVPTARALAMTEDDLPEGPGELLGSVSENTDVNRVL